MAAAEQADEQGPEDPVGSEVDEGEADPGADAGDEARPVPEQGVGHVPAVELADGDQVEGGDEEAEPCGETERAEQQRLFRGEPAVDEGRGPLEKQRLSEKDTARVGVGGERASLEYPEGQHGQADGEAGQGAGDADVEERPPVWD